MTDIVEWLRAYADRTTVIDIKRLDEAAAEIERLRAALEEAAGGLGEIPSLLRAPHWRGSDD